MREITKEQLDQNTTAITIKEDGKSIVYDAFPSIPAFKSNGILSLNHQLKSKNHLELTTEEVQLIQSWMDAA